MSDITVSQSTRRNVHVDADALGVASLWKPTIRIRTWKRINGYGKKTAYLSNSLSWILLTNRDIRKKSHVVTENNVCSTSSYLEIFLRSIQIHVEVFFLTPNSTIIAQIISLVARSIIANVIAIQ